jgi:hypothetical protein
VAPNLTLINVCVDWQGNPILLFDEGREAFPRGGESGAVSGWYKTIPTAHHLFRSRHGAIESLRIPNHGNSILTRFAQPFGSGWLLADARGGAAKILDAQAEQVGVLNLGDAIEDLQTTSDNRIWVSYFDEGVFGGGIGSNGLVCFDAAGDVKCEFAKLAEISALPHVDDCYALNVCNEHVWLSYYSDFPLIRLKDFHLDKVWKSFGPIKAFAVRGDELFCVTAYGTRSLFVIDLTTGTRTDDSLVDDRGMPIDASWKLSVAARLDRLYLYTNEVLFELP